MIILYFNSRKKYAATKKYGPAPAPPPLRPRPRPAPLCYVPAKTEN